MQKKDLQKVKRILEYIENEIGQKKSELKRFETHSGCSYRTDATEEIKAVYEEIRDVILKEFPELKNKGGE